MAASQSPHFIIMKQTKLNDMEKALFIEKMHDWEEGSPLTATIFNDDLSIEEKTIKIQRIIEARSRERGNPPRDPKTI